jgi:hypothetical protein
MANKPCKSITFFTNDHVLCKKSAKNLKKYHIFATIVNEERKYAYQKWQLLPHSQQKVKQQF